MNKLETLRKEIDKIDEALVSLFEKRLDLVGEIGREKMTQGLPIRDPVREERVVEGAKGRCEKDHEEAVASFMRGVIKLSVEHQEKL